MFKRTTGQGFGCGVAGVTVAVFIAAMSPQAGVAQEEVTFTRDVAPIIQQNCQACHRSEGIAPMSFTSYEEVRPWAPVIRQVVAARTMPPWHLDRSVGIQEYRNDASLSDEEIFTIVSWTDAGAPEGDPADLPVPPEFHDPTEFELVELLGEPDFVLRSDPFTVVANGQDQWAFPLVDIPVEEPRWIKGVEVKPSYPLGVRVTHHANAELWQGPDGDQRTGSLAQSGPGTSYELHPEGTGKLLLPGARTRFRLHYFPIGEEVPDDVVEIGVWLYPKGYEADVESPGQVSFRAHNADQAHADVLIPPHSVVMTRGEHTLEENLRIDSFRPHMHLRGKAMQVEAIYPYPEGRREVLWKADFQHTWHIDYQFAEESAPLLPKGTVLIVTAWLDNTEGNPYNPDPDQWVVRGDRSADEMAHVWTGITVLEDDQFESLVAERQRQEREEVAGDAVGGG